MFAFAMLGFLLVLLTMLVFTTAHDTWKYRSGNDFIVAAALYLCCVFPASGAFMLFVRSIQIAYGH